MKQSLSRKQLVIALIALMGAVAFVVIRYFQAPAFAPDSQAHGPLYKVTVADIKIDLLAERPYFMDGVPPREPGRQEASFLSHNVAPRPRDRVYSVVAEPTYWRGAPPGALWAAHVLWAAL